MQMQEELLILKIRRMISFFNEISQLLHLGVRDLILKKSYIFVESLYPTYYIIMYGVIYRTSRFVCHTNFYNHSVYQMVVTDK